MLRKFPHPAHYLMDGDQPVVFAVCITGVTTPHGANGLNQTTAVKRFIMRTAVPEKLLKIVETVLGLGRPDRGGGMWVVLG